MELDLSYQEKSIVGSLLAMIVVYGYYFAAVLKRIGTGEIGSGVIGHLMFTVIAIIVIEIVYHIILATISKPERKDERDILIEAKAYRNAYFMMATGAALVLTYFIVAALTDGSPRPILLTPFLIVNLILFFMVLAEIFKLVTQLLYYRKGF